MGIVLVLGIILLILQLIKTKIELVRAGKKNDANEQNT